MPRASLKRGWADTNHPNSPLSANHVGRHEKHSQKFLKRFEANGKTNRTQFCPHHDTRSSHKKSVSLVCNRESKNSSAIKSNLSTFHQGHNSRSTESLRYPIANSKEKPDKCVPPSLFRHSSTKCGILFYISHQIDYGKSFPNTYTLVHFFLSIFWLPI